MEQINNRFCDCSSFIKLKNYEIYLKYHEIYLKYHEIYMIIIIMAIYLVTMWR